MVIINHSVAVSIQKTNQSILVFIAIKAYENVMETRVLDMVFTEADWLNFWIPFTKSIYDAKSSQEIVEIIVDLERKFLPRQYRKREYLNKFLEYLVLFNEASRHNVKLR